MLFFLMAGGLRMVPLLVFYFNLISETPVMTKFVLVSGLHADEKGRQYKKGDIVQSPHNLPSMFPNKFRPWYPDSGPVAVVEDTPVAAPVVVETAPVVASTEEDTKDDERGTNVTASFPDAVEADLLVFAVAGGHDIYDHGEKLNKKPSKTVESVNKIIASYI